MTDPANAIVAHATVALPGSRPRAVEKTARLAEKLQTSRDNSLEPTPTSIEADMNS
jgi:hypothetical protein